MIRLRNGLLNGRICPSGMVSSRYSFNTPSSCLDSWDIGSIWSYTSGPFGSIR